MKIIKSVLGLFGAGLIVHGCSSPRRNFGEGGGGAGGDTVARGEGDAGDAGASPGLGAAGAANTEAGAANTEAGASGALGEDCIGTQSVACGDCGRKTCDPASGTYGPCLTDQPSRPCGTCGTQTCSSTGIYGACVPAAPQCLSPTQLRSCPAGAEPDYVTTTCEHVCTANACGGVCNFGDTRCAPMTERREHCGSKGQWDPVETCAAGSLCQGNGTSCKKADGEACSINAECVTGTCKTSYRDFDRDSYGSAAPADTSQRCGAAVPAGYVANASDCCDKDDTVNPAQTAYFQGANACGSFDYDCVGGPVRDPIQDHGLGSKNCNLSAPSCTQTAGFVGAIPACGVSGQWSTGCTISGSQGGPFCADPATKAQIMRCR